MHKNATGEMPILRIAANMKQFRYIAEDSQGTRHEGEAAAENAADARSKLEEDCTEPKIIQTVWGVGYKLNSAGVMPTTA